MRISNAHQRNLRRKADDSASRTVHLSILLCSYIPMYARVPAISLIYSARWRFDSYSECLLPMIGQFSHRPDDTWWHFIIHISPEYALCIFFITTHRNISARIAGSRDIRVASFHRFSLVSSIRDRGSIKPIRAEKSSQKPAMNFGCC